MMSYVPRFPPYAHQAEALAKMDGKDAYALLMAMRTGKTKTLLDDFGRLEAEGKADQLFVIAPGGVYRTWAKEAEKHWSEDLWNRTLVHVWESKGTAKPRAQFLSAFHRPKLLVMNVEALSSVKAARELALEFTKDGRTMLAIDESTIIKNHSSKRTKFINEKLSPAADYRRILSGLPDPKSPLDFYSQFHFLDWRIIGARSYYAFRNRYAVMKQEWFGGRLVQVVNGYQNVEDLARRIEPFSSRVRLADCYDLPEKMYLRHEVEMTPKQKRHYESMRHFATTQLESGDHVTATIVIAQILRMHQILCGHVRDELGGFHQIEENRTTALMDILEGYDGKAIIWCSYNANIESLSEVLGKEYGSGSVARFWGGNTKDRETEEQRFLTDPDCRFMLSTPAAGGRGRTWPVADLMIYFSNTYDLEHRSQSEERAQAIGKTNSVAYVDLVVPGTVDELILKVLREKIDLSSAIMKDGYQKWVI